MVSLNLFLFIRSFNLFSLLNGITLRNFNAGILYLLVFFFIQFQSYPQEIKNNSNSLLDSNGRNYKIHKDGSIFFPINKDYFSVVPSLEEFTIHIAEADELEKNQEVKRALTLRKYLSFCAQLAPSSGIEPLPPTAMVLKNSKILGKILSTHSGRIPEELKTELCYVKNNLYFRVEEYGISLQFPTSKLEKSKILLSQTAGKDRDSEWILFRLLWREKSTITEEAQSTPDSDFIEKSDPKDLYFYTIAMSTHPSDNPSEKFLTTYWERRRALTTGVKSIMKYTRTTEDNFDKINYTIPEMESPMVRTQYERYIFSNKKGVSLFFNIPDSKTPSQIENWKKFLTSIRFRGKKITESETPE